MSVSSTVRKAGPFIGAGTVSTFPFPFIIFEKSDLEVVTLNIATGVESTLVLDTDYSAIMNANQDANPGGSISLLDGSLPSGYSLIITTNIPQLQGTELVNQGGFYPEVLTNSLDLLTILLQQEQEQLNRTISFPISDPSGIDTQIPPVAQRAGMYLTFDANGAPQTVVAAPGSASPSTLVFGFAESTSTENQTVFTAPPYTPGASNLFVTCGGLTLAVGIDYTETSETSVTLTAPSPAGEVYTFRSIVASNLASGAALPYVQTVPYAASLTLNAGQANGFFITGMTGNLTLAGIWGLTAGQPIAMFYQQDGVGGRAVRFPAIMVGAAQPDPTPNAVSVQLFAYDAVTGVLRSDGPLVSANGAFFAQGISAVGAVSAASGGFTGPLTAASAALAGLISAATANIAGLLTAASATVQGALSAASAAITGALTAASATISGALKVGSFTLNAPGAAGQVLTNVGGNFVPQNPPDPAATMSGNLATVSRVFSVAYTNTSGGLLLVTITGQYTSQGTLTCYVNGQIVGQQIETAADGETGSACMTFLVPAGATYEANGNNGSGATLNLEYWTEWTIT